MYFSPSRFFNYVSTLSIVVLFSTSSQLFFISIPTLFKVMNSTQKELFLIPLMQAEQTDSP